MKRARPPRRAEPAAERRAAARAADPRDAARLAREEKGRRTRQAILDAAVELYAESGYRGTGLMAIGERAGVHHATVLYHFRRSRDLLIAVLEERDRRLAAFSRDARAKGGLAAIAGLPDVARFNLENPVWARLFTVLQAENLDPAAEAHGYFLARRRARRRGILRWLREAEARGEIRADVDPAAVAESILAFAAGIQVQYFLDPERVDPVDAYERFTAMLVRDLTRGLRAKAATRPAT